MLLRWGSTIRLPIEENTVDGLGVTARWWSALICQGWQDLSEYKLLSGSPFLFPGGMIHLLHLTLASRELYRYNKYFDNIVKFDQVVRSID